MRLRFGGWSLCLTSVIVGRTLAAQAPRLPEFATSWDRDTVARRPAHQVPSTSRHAHVRDGVLVGASIGGFAGAFIGLADQRVVCPSSVIVCKTPDGKVLSLVAGLAIGGVAGGVTGGVIGAFVHSTDRPDRTVIGLAIAF